MRHLYILKNAHLNQWRNKSEQKGKISVKVVAIGLKQMTILTAALVLLMVLVFTLVMTCHSSPALEATPRKGFQYAEDPDYNTYNSHLDFSPLLKKYIKENEERDGNLHGHIVAVNQAHIEAECRDEKSKKDNLEIDNNKEMPLMEEIEQTNEDELKELPFEGDITLLPEDRAMIDQQDVGPESRRNVINLKTRGSRLWPNGVVRFAIAKNLASLRPKILAAINMFEKHTCLKFIEVSLPFRGDFIKFYKGKGCASYVGRIGRRQKLSLGSGCEYLGVIMHETMHALGVWHEQSRPDRDDYVEVLWNNINPKFVKNFKKLPASSVNTLGLDYDYRSIMHYDRFLFAKRSGLYTLIAKGRPWKRLGGQRDAAFTSNDIKEIKRLYNCS